MRNFHEPTGKNFLREPLALGVPVPALLLLILSTCVLVFFGGESEFIRFGTILYVLLAYICLRLIQAKGVLGWEEAPLFYLEQRLGKRAEWKIIHNPMALEFADPDTSTDSEVVDHKERLENLPRRIEAGKSVVLRFLVTPSGFQWEEIQVTQSGRVSSKTTLEEFSSSLINEDAHIYTLYNLPTRTDPRWLSLIASRLPKASQLIVRFDGLDQESTKRHVSSARKRSAHDGSAITDIDSEVSFAEASEILEGISRGDEHIVRASLVIITPKPISLPKENFILEKKKLLPISAILGLRKRPHRAHIIRATTATDLLPTVNDASHSGFAVLRTRRGHELSFDPLDSRLEALHWIVVGASGSGKSFFTGLMLRRLLESGANASALFLDHNRSFRRLVKSDCGTYLEPESIACLERKSLYEPLDRIGTLQGIELSDLSLEEKPKAARLVLIQIEDYLRNRSTEHVIYLVLDECWNFLRDEPVLVQRAFREYRKLNGAVIAITQSLGDFVTESSGQSIFQNAATRILLRQGEDLSPYQRLLSLNDRELALTKSLRQEKGQYSECLIKTPFLSRLGRLVPTPEEHALLRTDNLRAEIVQARREERLRYA